MKIAIGLLAIGMLATSCTPLPRLDDGKSGDSPSSAPSSSSSGVPPGGTTPRAPNTQTLSVGPAGGQLAFDNGVVLDVPPGALSETVQIGTTVLTSVPAESDLPAEQFVTGVRLQPDGLVFAVPATLTLPLPSQPENLAALAFEDGPRDVGGAGTPGDGAESDPLMPEQVPILGVSNGSVRLEVWHFSLRIIADATCNFATKVGEIASCDNATICTEGISAQIQQVWASQAGGALAAMPSSVAPPLSAYLGASALADLEAAAKIAPVRVNYAWRSLATEVVTQHCPKHAAIGKSLHGTGAALDVQTIGFNKAKELCQSYLKAHPNASPLEVMDVVVPNVGRALLAHNWVWWGLYNTSTASICNDPVHFEHRTSKAPHIPMDDPSALRTGEVKAFQTLWNANSPCRIIGGDAEAPSGILDAATIQALKDSPRHGFPSTSPVTLGEAGIEGGGCPQGSSKKTETTCCPYKPVCGSQATEGDPSCHDTKTERDNCGSCGNRCKEKQHCSDGECVCDDGFVFCPSMKGGECLDPATFASDPRHCGGCHPCSASERCEGGTCVSICPCPIGQAATGDPPHECSPIVCDVLTNVGVWTCSGGRPCCPDYLASGNSPYPACGHSYVRGFNLCPGGQGAAWCSRPEPPPEPDPSCPPP